MAHYPKPWRCWYETTSILDWQQVSMFHWLSTAKTFTMPLSQLPHVHYDA